MQKCKIKSLLLCCILFFSITINATKIPRFVYPITGLFVLCGISYCLYARHFLLNNLLLRACEQENRNLIKFLIWLGADINYQMANDSHNNFGGFPHYVLDIALTKDMAFLDFLVEQGLKVPSFYLLRATEKNNMSLVRKYVEYGVDATKARVAQVGLASRSLDNREADCMHHACRHGNKDMIALLQTTGIDINDQSSAYQSKKIPIMFAYRSIEGLRILDYLIEKGAQKISYYEMGECYVRDTFDRCLESIRALPDAAHIIENIVEAQIFSIDPSFPQKTFDTFAELLLSCIKDSEKQYELLQKLCTDYSVKKFCLEYRSYDDDNTLITLLLSKNSHFFDLEL